MTVTVILRSGELLFFEQASVTVAGQWVHVSAEVSLGRTRKVHIPGELVASVEAIEGVDIQPGGPTA